MARSKKDINLLDVLEGKKKIGLSRQALVALICIPLLALVAVATIFLFTTTITNLLEQRNGLKNYLESPQTQAAYQETALAKDQSTQMRADANALIAALQNLSSYPELYSEQYNRIFELAGYEIDLSEASYDRRTGVLKFNATAAELVSLPRFVESMRNSGLFTDIQYRGYVQTKTGIILLSDSSAGTSGTPNSSATAGSGTSGGSGSGSGSAAQQATTYEIISYYYAIECLVAPPQPTLPILPEPAEQTEQVEQTAQNEQPEPPVNDPSAAQGGA